MYLTQYVQHYSQREEKWVESMIDINLPRIHSFHITEWSLICSRTYIGIAIAGYKYLNRFRYILYLRDLAVIWGGLSPQALSPIYVTATWHSKVRMGGKPIFITEPSRMYASKIVLAVFVIVPRYIVGCAWRDFFPSGVTVMNFLPIPSNFLHGKTLHGAKPKSYQSWAVSASIVK